MRMDDAEVAFHQPVAAGDDFLEIEGDRPVDPDAEVLGFLDAFKHPGRDRKGLAGQRPRGHAGAAELGAAFDQADASAEFGRFDRGRDSGFASADNGRVETDRFHRFILPEPASGSKGGERSGIFALLTTGRRRGTLADDGSRVHFNAGVGRVRENVRPVPAVRRVSPDRRSRRSVGPAAFPNILAITFTRNAAREMKERILDWLKEGFRAKGETPKNFSGSGKEYR